MKKEIVIFGLQRSGNHALVNFLLGHVNEAYVVNWRESRHLGLHKNRVDIRELEENNLSTDFIPFPDGHDFRILSIENAPDARQIENIRNGGAVTKRMVILRDPYNWLSSIIKRLIGQKRKKGIDPTIESYRKQIVSMISKWKNYARFVMEGSDKCLFVNFNRFSRHDPSFRRTISEYIGEDFSDIGIRYVSSIGSSFDNKDFQCKALDMDLEGRYKDEELAAPLRFFVDDELKEYSDKIFGFTA